MNEKEHYWEVHVCITNVKAPTIEEAQAEVLGFLNEKSFDMFFTGWDFHIEETSKMQSDH